MLKPAFIDLSHWNTVPESLKPARASGIVGVVHKATEGTGNVDDKVDARYFLARDADMLWGLYHFIRPGDIADQVDFFLETAADVSDDRTMFALDWEDTGVDLSDAVEFMQRLEQQTKRSPVLYSGHVLKQALDGVPDDRISGYRLWLAQYASEPDLPPGFDAFWGWQYTDQGSIAGIQPPTDLNAYSGTARELRLDWSGAAISPHPKPPEPGAVTVIAPPGINVRVIESE